MMTEYDDHDPSGYISGYRLLWRIMKRHIFWRNSKLHKSRR
jgi:hypothetical protein